MSVKQEINLCLLLAFFLRWAGLADTNTEHLSVDSNDQDGVKHYIKEDTLPFLKRKDRHVIERAKLALQAVLSMDDFDYDGYHHPMYIPFESPEEPRDLYLWIWEVCFPDTPFLPLDLSKYHVMYDVEDPDFKTVNRS